ncbi:MAG: phosphate ABC transporter permease subunit PstC [Caldisericaceae bacterium]
MKRKKVAMEIILPVFGYFAVIVLIGIIFTVLSQGLPLFKNYSIRYFLFGTQWRPVNEPPLFGSLPLVVASLYVSVFSMFISVPIGISTAIYLSKFSSRITATILKPIIEILASIPSVVYGFFGVVFLSPFLQRVFGVQVGLNGLNASVILSVMALPTIASLAEDAISSVPNDIEIASYGVGASRLETLLHITLPASFPGIIGAVSLGFGRAIGETMAVLMVAGGATAIPGNILDPMRPITATVAAEMAEAPVGGLHYQALFDLAIILMIFVLVFNLIAQYFRNRIEKRKI